MNRIHLQTICLALISNKCFQVPFMPKLRSSNTNKDKLWLAGALLAS